MRIRGVATREIGATRGSHCKVRGSGGIPLAEVIFSRRQHAAQRAQTPQQVAAKAHAKMLLTGTGH